MSIILFNYRKIAHKTALRHNASHQRRGFAASDCMRLLCGGEVDFLNFAKFHMLPCLPQIIGILHDKPAFRTAAWRSHVRQRSCSAIVVIPADGKPIQTSRDSMKGPLYPDAKPSSLLSFHRSA